MPVVESAGFNAAYLLRIGFHACGVRGRGGLVRHACRAAALLSCGQAWRSAVGAFFIRTVEERACI